jgi:hypothetical protein
VLAPAEANCLQHHAGCAKSAGLTRRQLLLAGVALLAPAPAFSRQTAVTPERFGARGDGQTNDTAAFAAMARFVTSRGGGEIQLRRTTYIVGLQVRSAKKGAAYAFEPSPIMDFIGCRGPLVIRGNGARLRCAPGLRYGTFDRVSGQPTRHAMPYLGSGEVAGPYRAMIRVEGCSGSVEISDLELDGGVQHLRIGGQYGDNGWQLPGTGIWLINNRGPERLLRIHTHHHALDGIIIDGLEARAAVSTLQSVQSEFNGRQGCSIVGGKGYAFIDCAFNHTGRSAVASAPGAGVDIEAEAGKRIRDLDFLRCTFSNNTGAGVIGDAGDAETATFTNCRFIGTTSWAAWPNRPRFRFTGCMFVGSIVHAYGDKDAARACQFHNCSFRDDPALSPTRAVYGGDMSSRAIANLPDNPNVLFVDCRFRLTHRSVLPWTTNVVIFKDCTMTQRAFAKSYPRGTFLGRNTIAGNVDLYGSRIHGELIVNGLRMS